MVSEAVSGVNILFQGFQGLLSEASAAVSGVLQGSVCRILRLQGMLAEAAAAALMSEADAAAYQLVSHALISEADAASPPISHFLRGL